MRRLGGNCSIPVIGVAASVVSEGSIVEVSLDVNPPVSLCCVWFHLFDKVETPDVR